MQEAFASRTTYIFQNILIQYLLPFFKCTFFYLFLNIHDLNLFYISLEFSFGKDLFSSGTVSNLHFYQSLRVYECCK